MEPGAFSRRFLARYRHKSKLLLSPMRPRTLPPTPNFPLTWQKSSRRISPPSSLPNHFPDPRRSVSLQRLREIFERSCSALHLRIFLLPSCSELSFHISARAFLQSLPRVGSCVT